MSYKITSLNEIKKNSNSPERFSLISLFSGCGGMDLGFLQEGFNVLWANDINEWACKTYKRNFGNHIVCGDISEISLRSLPKADVVTGGFPCQDFSMIWKRGGINTERGNLYKYLVDVVRIVEPKIFIAENVKGLLSANKGNAIKMIEQDFQGLGKGYSTSINLVNFADYGTPQIRERVLIIGIRKDINGTFSPPNPTNTPDTYVSSKEALEGVESVPYNNEHQNIMQKTRERLELIPPGGNFTSIPKDSPYYVKGMISHVYRRLHPDKPSTTIIAGGGGGTWGYHYSEPRPLTNRERARLFGYPDDFIFEGSITEVRRQIGNSVPPIGILPIARKIKTILQDPR
jgi:DNA (cytosine-5)-methyltransferase 1